MLHQHQSGRKCPALIQSANEAAAQGDLAFAITQAEDTYRVAGNRIESAGVL